MQQKGLATPKVASSLRGGRPLRQAHLRCACLVALKIVKSEAEHFDRSWPSGHQMLDRHQHLAVRHSGRQQRQAAAGEKCRALVTTPLQGDLKGGPQRCWPSLGQTLTVQGRAGRLQDVVWRVATHRWSRCCSWTPRDSNWWCRSCCRPCRAGRPCFPPQSLLHCPSTHLACRYAALHGGAARPEEAAQTAATAQRPGQPLGHGFPQLHCRGDNPAQQCRMHGASFLGIPHQKWCCAALTLQRLGAGWLLCYLE